MKSAIKPDATFRNAKPAAKPYKVSDSAGLYLLIKPNGSKLWQMKYQCHGKAKTLSFGAYPLTTLVEAREARNQAKKLLQQGIDPSEAKRETKRSAVRHAQNTFKATALEWYEVNKGKWTQGYSDIVKSRLDRCLLPDLGYRPLSTITPQDVLDTLRKVEKRGAFDVTKRARQIAASVFTYGSLLGRCNHNPVLGLEKALAPRKPGHFAAISPDELPKLVKAINCNDARLQLQTRNALRLLMLTFVRPGEIRFARWADIDFEAATWTIPAERMKMRRDHIVPLSRQALAILREQRDQVAMLKSEWVFPGQNSWLKPISECTLVNAVKKLGFRGQHTAHGFRALARTAIRERLEYPEDVIEKQLAHEPKGSLGSAYDRTQFLTQRRQMMQDWADYVDEATARGEVIAANFTKSA
jgi:integrase